MNTQRQSRWSGHWLLRDYGMVVALVLLVALFSWLTLTEQFPTGEDAGRQVAERVLAQPDSPRGVLVVVRDTPEDWAFAEEVERGVKAGGATVLARVRGGAPDVRQAIERILAEGGTIDAIAANEVTASWSVYDRFPQLGQVPRVKPEPYPWPNFLKLSNLLGVANQTAIYALIAIGMTLVIVTGGIDLSVGSLVALSSVSTALLLRDWGGGAQAGPAAIVLAALVGTSLCAAAGSLNGVLITLFRLPPFIVTLGMMMMASGLAFRLSEGRSIPELPAGFAWLGRGRMVGVPNPVWLMLGGYLLAHVCMSRTLLGRYVYAIGGNREAARLSGVAVHRVLLLVYTLSGALAGLGGLVLTSQLSAGDPKFGQMYELEVIAAVVVGGTSLQGGYGKVFGTLIGAFIIAVIKNGMNLLNVDPYNQKIVLGGVLMLAVLLDTAKRRSGH